MNIRNLLLIGFSSSFVFVYSVFVLFYHNPRYMLFMLPKNFNPNCKPTTIKEKRTYYLFMIITTIFLVAYISTCFILTYEKTKIGFFSLFLQGYIVMMLMNLADYFVMDLILITITAKNFANKLNMEISDFRPFKLWKSHLLIEHILFAFTILCPIIGLLTGGISWLFLKYLVWV